MAINFDTLPQENPNSLPKPGLYKVEIVETEMKTPKAKPDGTIGLPYLNIRYNLYNHEGKNCGTLYDIISESDAGLARYKLARFIRACGIPLTGTMELRDLAKIVKGKKLALDVRHTTPKKGEEANFTPKAEVDLFTREAYYLASEYADVYELINPSGETTSDFGSMNEPTGGEDTPFDAADGAVTPKTEY